VFPESRPRVSPTTGHVFCKPIALNLLATTFYYLTPDIIFTGPEFVLPDS